MSHHTLTHLDSMTVSLLSLAVSKTVGKNQNKINTGPHEEKTKIVLWEGSTVTVCLTRIEPDWTGSNQPTRGRGVRGSDLNVRD